MITKERLVEISNNVATDKEIDSICLIVGKKMKEVAQSGGRTFQIECIKPRKRVGFGSNGENYHYVFVPEGCCISQYSDKIVECFIKNGFTYNDIECATITNDYYSSVQITIRW
jgi:hypothetical protein